MTDLIDNVTLADPWWLLALATLPIVAYLRGRRASSALAIPFAGKWRRPAFAGSSKFATFLAFIGAALTIIALSRPQMVELEQNETTEGYDIMLALDMSQSMEYEDMKKGGEFINRLDALKPIVHEFIDKRQSDRIGVVAYSTNAYTLAPLTTDKEWIATQVDRLDINTFQGATAVGNAISVAINRIKEGAKEESENRVGAFIVLLTDGADNASAIPPLDAADIAAKEGIPIFSIGAGTIGRVRAPRYNRFTGERIGTTIRDSDIDLETLKEIAKRTNGYYFHASDREKLEEAFAKIDEATKIEFESSQYDITSELFHYFALGAGGFLFVSLGLSAANRKEALS